MAIKISGLLLSLVLVVVSTGYTQEIELIPEINVSPRFNPLSYPTLGIYVQNVSKNYISPDSLQQIENEFVQVILNKGYSIVARSDIDRVLKEAGFQSSLKQEEAIAKAARILNVHAIMIVSVNGLSTTSVPLTSSRERRNDIILTIRAGLIGAESADVLWTSQKSFNYIEYDYLGAPGGISIEKLLIMVSHGVAGGLPSRKTDDTNIE